MGEIAGILVSNWAVAVYAVVICTFEALFFIYVGPRFTKRAIMKGLKGEEGKAIMREIVISALTCMNEEYEQDTVDAQGQPVKVKTTLGALVMAQVAQSVVQHLKMTFLGEKGLLSKELGAIQGDAMSSAIPPQFAPYMGMLAPYIKKYPIIGMLATMFMGMKAGNPNSGVSAPAFSPQGGGYRGL